MTRRRYRAQMWVAILITALTFAMIAAVAIWATPDWRLW